LDQLSMLGFHGGWPSPTLSVIFRVCFVVGSVVGAKNLDEIKEWFARQDPYVVIEYGPNKFRTRTDTGLVLYFSVCLSMHPLEHPSDAQYMALRIKIG
jgi:hypothetical protein